MNIHFAFVAASLKMYFRNRQAIFWSLFFPLLIMLIFGLMNFDRFSPPDLGVADSAGNPASRALIENLGGADGESNLLQVTPGNRETLLEDLDKGDVDAVIEIPPGFGDQTSAASVRMFYDSRKPQENGIIQSVLSGAIERVMTDAVQVPQQYRVETLVRVERTEVQGKGQGYKGFLVPGVAAMAIMQGGLFGVVFTLVAFKARGVLRRLKAAPIGPSHILTGQVVTRIILSVMQTYVLLLVGILVLKVTIGESAASWLSLTVLAILGGGLFVAMGLAVSGWAKNEDTAAPVANVISLPMMFLSGVFFPVTAMPDWVQTVSQFLPLTYLADSLRAVALDGASLASQWKQMAGLAAWTVASFIVAVRLFKWER